LASLVARRVMRSLWARPGGGAILLKNLRSNQGHAHTTLLEMLRNKDMPGAVGSSTVDQVLKKFENPSQVRSIAGSAWRRGAHSAQVS